MGKSGSTPWPGRGPAWPIVARRPSAGGGEECVHIQEVVPELEARHLYRGRGSDLVLAALEGMLVHPNDAVADAAVFSLRALLVHHFSPSILSSRSSARRPRPPPASLRRCVPIRATPCGGRGGGTPKGRRWRPVEDMLGVCWGEVDGRTTRRRRIVWELAWGRPRRERTV